MTYHNSLARSLTLRIATELHLKRLIVGATPCACTANLCRGPPGVSDL